ncbi:hypothetical protein SBDP1_750003 [Syntrophobacter sp. SbD1]|nr:hypothetical protein SBDP1_750003 [Syntrophobacter sp. SbD1]
MDTANHSIAHQAGRMPSEICIAYAGASLSENSKNSKINDVIAAITVRKRRLILIYTFKLG